MRKRLFFALAAPFVPLIVFAAAQSIVACDGSTTASVMGNGGQTGTDAGVDSNVPSIAVPATCSPKTSCADACVDTTNDSQNCGGCGVTCKSTQRCATSSCVDVGAFGFESVFLGDSDRLFADSTTAWQLYGENIDGKTSVAGATDTCKLAPGAPTAVSADGPDGLDNSFGKNIIPILTTTSGSGVSQNISLAIDAGKFTEIFGIDAYVANQDQALLSTSFLTGAPLTSPPSFDGKDVWPITAESVSASGQPLVVFSQSSIQGSVFDSGPAGATAAVFVLPLQGASFPITIHKMHVTMTIDSTGSQNGNISGVLDTEEFVAAFQQVAGQISTSLCSGTAFASIAAQVRQASDIMKDGTQDPNMPCNGISIGIGFNAAPILLGATAAPVSPPPNPCP